MSKLSKKFMLSISAILVLVIALSLVLNNSFIERYYLYAKKQKVDTICQTVVENREELDTLIPKLENENQLVIITVDNTAGIEAVNETLRSAFLDKGLGLEKYWLWDQDYLETIEKGRKVRIYQQPKLNYSLLVEYIDMGDTFGAVAMIIPNVGEMITLINWFTVAIFGGAVLLILILLYFLVKKITSPLAELETAAGRIAEQDFCTVDIQTGDELESLGNSVNDMSNRLEEAQNSLAQKNRQMESLLGNVSHDLKTPISLIKAYTAGMRDGLDDGSFLDTLARQTDKMEQMVESLLNLSKTQWEDAPVSPLDISEILRRVIGEHALALQEQDQQLTSEIQASLVLVANDNAIDALFTNLLSNAIKYSAGNEITLSLKEQDDNVVFTIQNEVQSGNAPDTEHIWEPFYVGEASRNKELSGTGLGLPIVRAVAQQYEYSYDAIAEAGRISFIINFGPQ